MKNPETWTDLGKKFYNRFDFLDFDNDEENLSDSRTITLPAVYNTLLYLSAKTPGAPPSNIKGLFDGP